MSHESSSDSVRKYSITVLGKREVASRCDLITNKGCSHPFFRDAEVALSRSPVKRCIVRTQTELRRGFQSPLSRGRRSSTPVRLRTRYGGLKPMNHASEIITWWFLSCPLPGGKPEPGIEAPGSAADNCPDSEHMMNAVAAERTPPPAVCGFRTRPFLSNYPVYAVRYGPDPWFGKTEYADGQLHGSGLRGRLWQARGQAH
jgi:hypothetical protein